MNRQEIAAAFEEVFDQAIVFHGFAEHMRDYDVFVYATADPRTGIVPEHLRYRFTQCVRATATTAVRRDVWQRSLDDRLLDYEAYAADPDQQGYVWGVNWQGLYPGMSLREESAEADSWSRDVGIPFFEARIETNGHNLELIFSDLAVTQVEPGFAPFVIS
ncbi:MAG: HalD/BesD family halogenase [Streptomycetales bacterium]